MPQLDFVRANALVQRLDILGLKAVYGDHSRLQDNGNLSLELTFEQWEQLFLLAERGVFSEEVEA